MNRIIRIGTRDSQLAVIQAQIVARSIEAYCPDIHTELVPMKTTGDRILSVTLDKIGGKGLFVKELDRALKDGDVDITVHSMKDMPAELDPELPVVAVSLREDPRDVLVYAKGAGGLKDGLPIGCSSMRRQLQLKTLLSNPVLPVRGNVLTRLQKLDDGNFGALILAWAGLRRLNLQDRAGRVFSTEEMIPAAGQGILAVQARKGEDTSFLNDFHSPDAWDAAQAERTFIRVLDGGCSSPIAAYAQVCGDELLLSGLYFHEADGSVHKGKIRGSRADAQKLGEQLALQLRG
ncbi:MAG TPA: hydroxymethylbilane synthase [Firmicutes bacterium]|nr:hydroxymethylbilane synthase [Bacillota bacterium]